MAPGRAQSALFVEVLAEALRNERVADVVREAETRVAVALADRVRAAQRSGEATPDVDPDAVSEVLLALGDGLALRAARADEANRRDLGATLDVLVTRFLRSMPPPA